MTRADDEEGVEAYFELRDYRKRTRDRRRLDSILIRQDEPKARVRTRKIPVIWILIGNLRMEVVVTDLFCRKSE